MIIKALKRLMNIKDNRYNYILTDEDRERGQEIKRLKHETEKLRYVAEQKKIEMALQKAQLDFKEEYGNDDNNEAILIPLMQIFQSMKAGNNSKSPDLDKSAFTSNNLSDEDIKAFIAAQDKKYIKIAKTMPKSMVINQAMQKMGLSEQQANRAYDILIEEF